MDTASPEEQQRQEEVDSAKRKMKISFSWFLKSIWHILKDMVSIRKGADIDGTIVSIKKDIDFSGYTIWILMFSIFIASIGLNMNSGAVVIGAMLISPLMAPIIGLGFSLGTNDLETFLRSFRNCLIAVVVAVGTSFLYFKITPFQEPTSEIINRTQPQLLDVFIAIFGGLAGIIGASRPEKTNVVPGVAIATALMPPLCTAGYGLATQQYNYFFGAFYLFLLNTASIAITTLIVVRVMRFPILHFVKRRTERLVKWSIAFLAFLLVIPSGYFFYGLMQEHFFRRNAREFVSKEIHFAETELVQEQFLFSKDSISTVKLFFIGEQLDSMQMDDLRSRMRPYGLENTALVVRQGGTGRAFLSEIERMEEISVRNQVLYSEQKSEVDELKEHILDYERQLTLQSKDTIDIVKLETSLKHLYPELRGIGYGQLQRSDTSQIAQSTAILYWTGAIHKEYAEEHSVRIKRFLETQYNKKDVEVLNRFDQ